MDSPIEEIDGNSMDNKNQEKISRSAKYGFRYFINAGSIAKQLIESCYEKQCKPAGTIKHVPQEALILNQDV